MMTDDQKLYQRIYAMVRQIPPGRVTSYGRIAELVGGCTARMVGYAMAALKRGIAPDVPWQRVVNAKGKISVHGDGIGNAMQRSILEDEGIQFDESDRIDFSRFGWSGPEEPY
ncbi:MAG: MGMT family protein [Brevefilum sp.]|nr:MGMT family protein [Brevefilum sp.]MDT8381963.1 MGMT family protein [Brevefilum sp.]